MSYSDWTLLLLFSTSALAQAPFEQAFIQIPAVESRDQLAGEEEGYHWVIARMPVESDLQARDPLLRRAFADWLSENAKSSQPWLLDPGTNQNFLAALRASLTEFDTLTTGPAAFIARPPEEARAAAPVTLHINYRRKTRPIIWALTIRVMEEGWRTGATGSREQEMPPLAPGVRVFVRFVHSETAVRASLYELARAAASLSETHRIFPGKPQPPEPNLLAAQFEISQPYRYNQTRLRNLNWPVPDVKYSVEDPGKAAWQLEIGNVRVSAGARLDVPVLIRPAGAEGMERARQIAAKVQQNAGRRVAPSLATVKDTVPTGAALMLALAQVEQDVQLAPPCDLLSEGRILIFSCPSRWTRFGFALTSATGYSAEDQIVGSAAFSGDNLLRLSNPDHGRVERESATFSGFRETQRLSASWEVETSESGFKYGPRVRSFIFRDRHAFLANSTSALYTTGTAGAEYFVEYASKRWGFTAAVGPGFTFAEVAGLASGSYWTYDVSAAPSFVFAGAQGSDTGINEFRLAASLRLRQSLPDRDFSFVRTGGWIEGTLYFGFVRSRDFVFRHRSGIELGAGVIPLFELPRLGGVQQIRGLEEGEFIGRKAGYSQTSFGTSLENLLSWNGERRSDRGAGPLDLANLYIVAFVDRGTVGERRTFDRMLSGTDVFSFGVLGEVHRFRIGPKSGRFSVGYGYSPDSKRHRRGILITSAAIDLM